MSDLSCGTSQVCDRKVSSPEAIANCLRYRLSKQGCAAELIFMLPFNIIRVLQFIILGEKKDGIDWQMHAIQQGNINSTYVTVGLLMKAR